MPRPRYEDGFELSFVFSSPLNYVILRVHSIQCFKGQVLYRT